MRILTLHPGESQLLPAYGSNPPTVHVFDSDSIEAVNAALWARRPLLVRGEPGTGKSQLARAVAAALGRAFVSFTVDARTESRDLLFTVDLVARLAAAHVLGHRRNAADLDVSAELDERNFTSPGPLWWLLDWESAARQARRGGGAIPESRPGWQAADGVVVLIDEIDKADSAVPNGLLDVLGQSQFRAPGGGFIPELPEALPGTSSPPGEPTAPVEPPLVLLTTNEERALPDPFVRRCLVLQLAWPADEAALIESFVTRGRAHFAGEQVSEDVLRSAAEMLAEDRREVAKQNLCRPGLAEYLDLLRAATSRWPGNVGEQRAALARIRRFALRKHPAEPGW